ncbi:MAG: hypothetical protein QW568_00930 [Candidatus Anstonellaceae archaeon]
MVGGASTFRSLQFVGNGTELLNRPGSNKQARAVALLERKIPEAKALEDFGGRIFGRMPDRKPMKFSEDKTSKTPEHVAIPGEQDFLVLPGQIGPQDGESAEQRIRRRQKANGSKSGFEKSQLCSEIMPPITECQAVDLLKYYYFAWLYEQNPKDEQVAAKLKTYVPNYFDSPLLLEGNGIGDIGRARNFVSAINNEALRYAQDMIRVKIDIDERIAKVEQRLVDAMIRFETEKNEELAAISRYYSRKDARLAARIESSCKPSWVVEKIKEVAKKFGLGKIGVSIGALMSGASAAFEQAKLLIKDVIEHIPLLSQFPPELVGVSLVAIVAGGVLLAKGFSKALIWHFEMIRDSLPRREAAKSAKVRDKFAELEENSKRAHEQMKDMLNSYCEFQHADIEKKFRTAFDRLVSAYGYLQPN